MVADAGLGRQHEGVGAVEDGVGHVGRLGPRRPVPLHHRLQHLGGDDHRLRLAPAQVDRPLLHQRHPLQGRLHAQVAPGHHDPVEGLDDGVEPFQRLGPLELGDDRHPHADLFHHRPDGGGVAGGAHERQRHEVDPEAEGEAEVVDVLVGEGRAAHRHAGEVHPAVVPDRAAPGHHALHLAGADRQHPQLHRPVGQEDRVARADVVGQCGVRRRQAVGRPGGAGHADHQPGAAGQQGHPAEQAADAELGPLQVGQDADGPPGGVGGGPHMGIGVGVLVVVAVGEVEPGDVHPGADEGGDALRRGGGRPDRADDLGPPGGGGDRRQAGGRCPQQGLGHRLRP